MDAAKSKGTRLKRWQEKQLWIWRIAQKSETGRKAYARYYEALKLARNTIGLPDTEKKKRQRQMMTALSEVNDTQVSFLKYCRRMQRLASRGQIVNGKFHCKAGREVTQERVSRYEAMCHFMVRKFLPGLVLSEASLSYEDLINQCRLEVYLALLNGFDPKIVLKDLSNDEALKRLEQVIVYGRLRSYLRRLTWKFHPDQLGGRTWSYELLTERRPRETVAESRGHSQSREFHYKLFREPDLFPVDFVQNQQDRLLDILNQEGPEAAKKAFASLDPESREVIQESLFRGSDSITSLGEEGSC